MLVKEGTLKQREAGTKLEIDEEFRKLNPQKSKISLILLRKSLVEQGCLYSSPIMIVIRKGKEYIVDGHNRYALCIELGIPFCTIEVEFKDRDEIREWIPSFQVTNRSVRYLVELYQLGKFYHEVKGKQGKKSEVSYFSGGNTAERLAAELDEEKSKITDAAKVCTIISNFVEETGMLWHEAINKLVKENVDSFVKLEKFGNIKKECYKDAITDIENGVPYEEVVKKYNKKPQKEKAPSTTKEPKTPITTGTTGGSGGGQPADKKEEEEKTEPEKPVIEKPVFIDTIPVTDGKPAEIPADEQELEGDEEKDNPTPADNEEDEFVVFSTPVTMQMAKILPKYMFIDAEDNTIVCTINVGGEEYDCAISKFEDKYKFELPNVENLVIDFSAIFPSIISFIPYLPVEQEHTEFKLSLPLNEWNNFVNSRFPDYPELVISEPQEEAPEPVELVEPVTVGKRRKAIYNLGLKKPINKFDAIKVCGLDETEKSYNNIRADIKNLIKEGKLRETGEIDENKRKYYVSIPQVESAHAPDLFEVVMKAISDGLEETKLVNIIAQTVAILVGDALIELEKLEKAGKITKKLVDNENWYYPVSAEA